MRSQSPVGRAHDRLGAALVRFGLTGHVRAQRVLDVSASTPGFAALYLERGADHVGVLDVGPSPIPPALRTDPRVAIAERAVLKSLPAAAVPGPFLFFTIDVRFTSSRGALRAVAFRLAPNANGIVWLKPQFEVPAEERTAAGDKLADRARVLFREKATALGFEVAAEADGPDELILHLLYRGKPAR